MAGARYAIVWWARTPGGGPGDMEAVGEVSLTGPQWWAIRLVPLVRRAVAAALGGPVVFGGAVLVTADRERPGRAEVLPGPSSVELRRARRGRV